MASNVISQPVGAVVELSAIVNICKYRGFYEGHHFISMVRRCMAHLVVICIVSLVNVFIFSMIDVWEVVFLHSIFEATCLYCSLMCFSLCYRKEDYVGGCWLF